MREVEKDRDSKMYKISKNSLPGLRKKKSEFERWRNRKVSYTEQERVKKMCQLWKKISSAPSPPEQPSWVANYDELLGAQVGRGTSPVSV